MSSTRPMARAARLVLAISAVLTAVAVLSPAAQAAGCPSRTLSKPFAAFGDANNYFLVSNGSFESGTSGWSLGGASVANEGDSFRLNGSASDYRSLRVASTATSPRFCITPEDPHVRFAAKSVRTGAGANYSSLNVTAVIRNSSGSQMSYFLGSLGTPANANWFVTPELSWGGAFAPWLFAADGTAMLELVFTTQGTGGAWYIDDIFVDPYSGR